MMTPYVADRGRKGTRVHPWGLYAVGLIAGAIVPAALALALLASVALHRPLLARAAQPHRGVSATRLTVAWTLALATIAAVQGASAILGMESITTPAGFAARSGFALAVEAVALVSTAMYLKSPSRRAGGR
jgi:hypothetical protein